MPSGSLSIDARADEDMVSRSYVACAIVRWHPVGSAQAIYIIKFRRVSQIA